MIKERSQVKVSCTDCSISYLCLARQFSDDDRKRLDSFIRRIRIVAKGEHIYRDNDKLDYLYAVYSGSAKDYYVDEDGQETINNFYFPGDILALESVATKKYAYSAMALSAVELCMIPLNSLFVEMQTFPALMKRYLTINSHKMLNDKHIRPSTNAKQRVADFLINVLYRLEERTGTFASMTLPMSQVEIGNMIGIAYETVSRVLHLFEQEKIIKIHHRKVIIIDIKRLLALGNEVSTFGQKAGDNSHASVN